MIARSVKSDGTGEVRFFYFKREGDLLNPTVVSYLHVIIL